METTKQEQINEMLLYVPRTIVAYDANPKGQHLYGEQRRQIAVALYDVGYRKVPDDIKELIDMLSEGANKYKNLEIKYSHLCDNYRLCKDANETLKQNVINAGSQKVDRLEEENERLKEVNRQLNADYNRSLERLKSDCRQIDELNTEVKELKAELNARLTCNFVKTAQKQAQIEMLNRLKSLSIYDDNYLDGYVFIDDIEKLLEELTK